MFDWFKGLLVSNPSQNTVISYHPNPAYIPPQNNNIQGLNNSLQQNGSFWQNQALNQQYIAGGQYYIPNSFGIGTINQGVIGRTTSTGKLSFTKYATELLELEIFSHGAEQYIFCDYNSKQVLEFDTKEQYERHLETIGFNKSFEDKLNEEITD